jgi:hypothetical protein
LPDVRASLADSVVATGWGNTESGGEATQEDVECEVEFRGCGVGGEMGCGAAQLRELLAGGSVKTDAWQGSAPSGCASGSSLLSERALSAGFIKAAEGTRCALCPDPKVWFTT